MQYFYPPQPTRIWPNTSFFNTVCGRPTWDQEVKYNGWRVLVFKENNQIKIFNRHSTVIDILHSQFLPMFKKIPNNTVFDGELVHFRTTDRKNILVFWDVPFFDGNDISLKQLNQRRKFLKFDTVPDTLTLSPNPQVYRVKVYPFNSLLYERTIQKNDEVEEGVVYKNQFSTYVKSLTKGKDVTTWLKAKKNRRTCLRKMIILCKRSILLY